MRAGWAQIVERRDVLAAAAAEAVLRWDGGKAWPVGQTAQFDPDSCPAAAQWTAGLRPAPSVQPPTVLECQLLEHVSSIDRGGRYASGNQPGVAQWNLARLAEALLPLIDPDPGTAVAAATAVLDEFPARFAESWLAGMRRKLGLRTDEAGDPELFGPLLDWMGRTRADFTNTFRDLSSEEPPADDRYRGPDFRAWYARWRDRLGRDCRSRFSGQGRLGKNRGR